MSALQSLIAFGKGTVKKAGEIASQALVWSRDKFINYYFYEDEETRRVIMGLINKTITYDQLNDGFKSMLSRIVDKISHLLLSRRFTLTLISFISPGIATDIKSDKVLTKILLKLDELKTVELNDNAGFFQRIYKHLEEHRDPKKTDRLSYIDRSKMVIIMQLLIDVFEVLITIDPSIDVNEKTKGLESCPLLKRTDAKLKEELTELQSCFNDRAKNERIVFSILVYVLEESIKKAKESFEEDGKKYKWNVELHFFEETTDDIQVVDVNKSNANFDFIVFIIVLFDELIKNLKKRTIVEAPEEISVDSSSTDEVKVPELERKDQDEIESIKINRERSSSGSTDTSASSQHSAVARGAHKLAKRLGFTTESLRGGRKTKKSKKPRKTKKPRKYRKKQTRRM
jgi:hypothetical protein